MKVLSLNRQLVILLSLQTLFDSTIFLYLSVARFYYRSGVALSITLTEAILSPLLSLFLIYFFKLGYYGRILGALLPSGIICIFILFSTIFKTRSRVNYSQVKSIIKEGTQLFPSSIVGAFSGQFDRLIIAYLLGHGAIAKYSVAHSVGVGLFFVLTAISSALVPWILRRISLGEEERIFGVLKTLTVCISGATLFLVALAPEAITLIATREYAIASFAVAPIALSAIPTLFITVSSTVITQSGFGKLLFLSKIFALGAGIISALIFIPLFGYLGAGLSVFICEAACSSIQLLLLEKKKLCQGITLKKTIGLMTVPIVFSCICLLFYAYLPIRIILLSVPSVMLLNALIFGKEYLLEKAR